MVPVLVTHVVPRPVVDTHPPAPSAPSPVGSTRVCPHTLTACPPLSPVTLVYPPLTPVTHVYPPLTPVTHVYPPLTPATLVYPPHRKEEAAKKASVNVKYVRGEGGRGGGQVCKG